MVKDKAPSRLYLQWQGDASVEEIAAKPNAEPGFCDVTWCADKIHEHDIAYIRVDLLRGVVTADHESKDEFISRMRAIIG